jgi:hypothetical protein
MINISYDLFKQLCDCNIHGTCLNRHNLSPASTPACREDTCPIVRDSDLKIRGGEEQNNTIVALLSDLKTFLDGFTTQAGIGLYNRISAVLARSLPQAPGVRLQVPFTNEESVDQEILRICEQ